jgi:hypothetical protein
VPDGAAAESSLDVGDGGLDGAAAVDAGVDRWSWPTCRLAVRLVGIACSLVWSGGEPTRSLESGSRLRVDRVPLRLPLLRRAHRTTTQRHLCSLSLLLPRSLLSSMLSLLLVSPSWPAALPPGGHGPQSSGLRGEFSGPMQAVVSGQGRDGGPVAGALAVGLVARVGGRPDPGRCQGITSLLRRLLERPAAAASGSPGGVGWAARRGPSQRCTHTPGAAQTLSVWAWQ